MSKRARSEDVVVVVAVEKKGPFPFLDLTSDVIENEVIPHLDLSTTFSLSLTNKYFRQIKQDVNTLLRIKKPQFNFTGGYGAVLLIKDTIERGYHDLLVEMLSLLVRVFRSITTETFDGLIEACIRFDRLPFMKLLEEGTQRTATRDSTLFLCAVRSGKVAVFEELDRMIGPQYSGIDFENLFEPAFATGDMEMIEFIYKNRGRIVEDFVGNEPFVPRGAARTGNLKMIDWVRTKFEECEVPEDTLREVFADMMSEAVNAPNALEVVKYIFETSQTVAWNLVDEAASAGKFDVVEWAIANGSRYRLPRIIRKALEVGHIDFVEKFLQKYPETEGVSIDTYLNYTYLRFAMNSMNKETIEYALNKWNLSLDTNDANLWNVFLQNYRATKADNELWQWLCSKGMKFNLLEFEMQIGQSLLFTVPDDVFIEPPTLDFLYELGYHPERRDVNGIITNASQGGLRWILDRFPSFFEEADVLAAARVGRLNMFRSLIDHLKPGVTVIQDCIVDLLQRGHVNLLNYLLDQRSEVFSGIYSMDNFEFPLTRFHSTRGIPLLNGVKWLVNNHFKFGGSLYAEALFAYTDLGYFEWLVELKVSIPDNFSFYLARSPFYDDIMRARILAVLEPLLQK